MKKLSISIILIILLFSLAGCGYGEYTGNVIDKQYIPARITMQPIFTGKTTIIVPINHFEQYRIKIQKEDGEIKTTWITVGKEDYEKISIGDYWED